LLKSGLANSARGMGFPGAGQPSKKKAPSMDSKIIDRLVAGVAYERTRKGSPDVSWAERRENFTRILDEDLQFVAKMQVSVESRAFQSMTLNYQERRIYHWHGELDRRIGVERVPEHLRVPQVLDGRVSEGWL
jgi:hypothetical protein